MKIRNGFVSNSSSSSFLVGFAIIPKNPFEMMQILFGKTCTGMERFAYPYNRGIGDVDWSYLDIAAQIFHDFKNQKPLTKDEAFEVFKSGYFPGHPSWEEEENVAVASEYRKIELEYKAKFGHDIHDSKADKKWIEKWNKTWNLSWDRRKKFVDKIAKKEFNRLWKKLQKNKVFTFSYGDNEGEFFCTLEHGGIFNHMPGIIISNH